jgi:hypothetical protein
MAAQIELIGDRIIYMREEGEVNAAVFQASTEARIDFAQKHIDGFYVLIYDLSTAKLTFFDMKVVRHLMQVEPNLRKMIVISTDLLAAFGVKMAKEIFRRQAALARTREEAIAQANAFIAEELAKL